MARIGDVVLYLIVMYNLFMLQTNLGDLVHSLSSDLSRGNYYFAAAESPSRNQHNYAIETSQYQSEDKCFDCSLTSNSIEDLLKKPRQMNAYGQLEERIDLDRIQKGICKNIISDEEREKCRDFYMKQIDTIEKWKMSKTRTSFFDFICIKELKLCCPRNSFGPNCTRCNECNHNERCNGEGTRAGNGSCICKQGHVGKDCTSCEKGYYLEKPASSLKKETCKPCHKSCTSCRDLGPLGCEVCRSGYRWLPAHGCSDIDECIIKRDICGKNTFCVNTEGSYFCYECDRACDGCDGDGPDACLRCAKGYKLDRGNCVALKKTILPPEANYYRYAIYTGLCVCACIILHNNVYLASLVGLSVAMYIGVSEYIMSTYIRDVKQA